MRKYYGKMTDGGHRSGCDEKRKDAGEPLAPTCKGLKVSGSDREGA